MGNVQQYIGRRVEVGRYQVEAIKYLGEGGSSFIFLVKDVQRESAKPMVLKRLVAENDAAFQLLQQEIDMHQRFRHPQIVEFYASQVNRKARDEREVFILMEYCPSGHLFENMTKMGEKRFKERDLLYTFRSLCVPVNILHHCDPPIAHRDLKLENFLMAQNGTYKLCDFGSCVEGPQSLKTKEDRARESEHVLKRTTAMYRSPELADVEGTAMFGAGELTEAVDVWAMGCVLYTMAFFKPPFPPEGLRTERYTIPKDSKYSPNLHQLIARMLQADVERRATIDHVIECIDELLEDRPLPKWSGAPPSPKKTAAPPAAKKPQAAAAAAPRAPSAPGSRDNSFGKTTEARKESVTSTTTHKAPPPAAMDLLDMSFNPTISSPPPSSTGAAPAASAKLPSDGWTTTTPSAGFADFANFPTSPSAFGSASSSVDPFGFPASPVKTTPTQPPSFGFATSPPPAAPTPTMMTMPVSPPSAAKADPFEGLGGGGFNPAMGMGGMMGMGAPARAPAPQGFQQQGFQQQPMMMGGGGWPQQQYQQQQQPVWPTNNNNHHHQGAGPRGF